MFNNTFLPAKPDRIPRPSRRNDNGSLHRARRVASPALMCLARTGRCPAQVIALHDGKIQSIARTTEAAEPIMALPALVNAHDHGRAVRTSSIGADAKPLESWIHYLALFPAVDPYVAACVAFASSALGGAGIVMNHYTRVQGFTDLPTELAEVSRAARDVGVRAGLAVAMRDRNPLVYGPRNLCWQRCRRTFGRRSRSASRVRRCHRAIT